MARFYKKDVVLSSLEGARIVKNDVLHFSMSRASLDRAAIAYEFDGIAEARHIRDYAGEYQTFLHSLSVDKDKVVEPKRTWPVAKLRMISKLFGRFK